MKAIKAAAVQAAPVYLNLDASIAKAAEIVSEATAEPPGQAHSVWTHQAQAVGKNINRQSKSRQLQARASGCPRVKVAR